MKTILSLLLFIISTGISLNGQVDSVSLYYADQISEEQLKFKIDILADDTLLGRETAMEGQKRAEKFIVSEFKKYSIEPGNDGSYLQYFNVYNLNYNKVDFVFNESSIGSEKQLINTNISKDCKVSGQDLIFCGYGISTEGYNDYIGLDVYNKLVFVLDGTPKDDIGKTILSKDEDKLWKWKRELKEDLARQSGASGIVFIKDDFSGYSSELEAYIKHGVTKLFDESSDNKNFPSIAMDDKVVYSLLEINREDLDKYMLRVYKGKKNKVIQKKGAFSLEFEVDIELNRTSNVLGAIECDDPMAPWVVLSAHYDHLGYDSTGVYNGADDNGSGTASVLELARVFKNAHDDGNRPKKNLLFILVSGEEKGLLGSEFYTQNPVYSIESTMVNLNIDMIGRVDNEHTGNSNYVYVIGADRISQKLHDINESMNDLYTKMELDYTYNEASDPNKYYRRSDHYNFAKNGVPVIFYFNGTHEDYHRKGDTKDKIDFKALTNRTKLIFHTTWELSNMNGGLFN